MSAAAPLPYPGGGHASQPARPASSGGGGGGSERGYAHIEDLLAQSRVGYNPQSSIRHLLELAEKGLAQATNLANTFRRPDLAFVEYIRASDIVAYVIPRHKDFGNQISFDRPDLQQKYKVLQNRVNAMSDQYASIRQIIINNNKRHGTSAAGAGDRPNGSGLARSTSVSAVNGHTGAHPVGAAPANGVKARPPPTQKPERLHGPSWSQATATTTNGILAAGGRSIDPLAARFANLRTSGADPRRLPDSNPSSTNSSPLSLTSASDYGGRISFEALPPARHPLGPRGMPDGYAPTPLTTMNLPQEPAAAYSPARNMHTMGNIAPPRHTPRSLTSASTRRSSMAPASSASAHAPNGPGSSGEYFPTVAAEGAASGHPPRRISLAIHQEITISAERLYDYLERYNILLIDFRPRAAFDGGHVFHRNIMCVEPMQMRPGMSAEQLQDSLVISPENEANMFHQRDQFDLVVYYDAGTRDAYPFHEVAGDDVWRLKALHESLWDFNQEKPLRHKPVLLQGGIDAWEDLVGQQALVESNTSSRVKQGRPIGRRPLATSNLDGHANLKIPKRRLRNYDPLDEEEEKKWRERARAESVVLPQTPGLTEDEQHQQHEQESMGGGDEGPDGVEMAIREFRERFPDAGDLDRHAFASQLPTRTPPPLPAKIPEYPPRPAPSEFPGVPVRPAPAAPRMSYTGVSDRAVSATTPQTRTLSGQYVPSKYLATNLRLPRTGLMNFGNTCYMNSTLQALSATTPLSIYFMDDAFRSHIQRDNWRGSKGVMAELYANLIRSLWKGDVECIRPTTFRGYVKRICDAFNNEDQQDAKEFLELLLDQLHEDVNSMWSRTPLRALTDAEEAKRERMPKLIVAKTEWGRFTHRSLSFVQSLFAGQHASKLTCLSCGFTSTTYEVFTSISVEIPQDQRKWLANHGRSVTLEDCLRSYCSEEQLITDNAWRCPRCKTTREAAKRITLTRAPQFLVIHFKRFATTTSTFSGRANGARKVRTPVDFPLTGLDLGPYMLPQPTPEEAQQISRDYGPDALKTDLAMMPPYRYDCYAVVKHLGQTEKSGHYMCATKDAARRCWRLYNDKYTSDFQPDQLSPQQRLQNEDAYIVFYQRNTGAATAGGPMPGGGKI